MFYAVAVVAAGMTVLLSALSGFDPGFTQVTVGYVVVAVGVAGTVDIWKNSRRKR